MTDTNAAEYVVAKLIRVDNDEWEPGRKVTASTFPRGLIRDFLEQGAVKSMSAIAKKGDK